METGGDSERMRDLTLGIPTPTTHVFGPHTWALSYLPPQHARLHGGAVCRGEPGKAVTHAACDEQ